MRIAVGGISHETSTFAPTPTTLRDFETGFGLFRGGDIVERFRGTNNCTGGFIDGAAAHGFELVPLLWTFAYPGGLIVNADYTTLKNEFLDRLVKARQDGPIDGVLLDLHGAMVVEGIDDGDGDFIAAVRQVVGANCPIVVTFDLHGNHTQKRVDAATAIIGFDTYPHVDMAERGREAANLIVRILRGEVRPVMALRRLPLFWSAACQVTAHPPIDEAFRLVHEAETRPGILSITLATGFPWADVPQMGASVIVVALSAGRFTYDGPMYAGLTGDLGPSAWLRHAGVNVVAVSSRMQPLDQAFARSLGINCASMRYIAVKSAVHFRSGFESIAGSIHNINAQAIHTHDFAQLPYRRRARPMYPLDPFPPETREA